jgi:hypothetical protein
MVTQEVEAVQTKGPKNDTLYQNIYQNSNNDGICKALLHVDQALDSCLLWSRNMGSIVSLDTKWRNHP